MLVHKGGQINTVQLITGVKLQRCHNYKIAVSCLQRMEVIVKMKNKVKKSQGEGGGGGGGSGGCVRSMEVIVKMKKKSGGMGDRSGGGGGGVRVDVYIEWKLL